MLNHENLLIEKIKECFEALSEPELEQFSLRHAKPIALIFIDLADCLKNKEGQNESAEYLYKFALSIFQSAHADNSIETAAAMISQANLLIEHTNRSDEAEDLYQRALSLTENKFGIDDIQTIPAINALSFYYLGCG